MPFVASLFSPAGPGAGEIFTLVRPEGGGGFAAQLAEVFDHYRGGLADLTLPPDSAVTATVFLSDSANQEAALRAHPGFLALAASGAAVTVVQQPPAGAKLALQAYHVRDGQGTRRRARVTVPGARGEAMGLQVATPDYRFTYLKNLLAPDGGDAGAQTEALMGAPGRGAQSNGIALGEVARTWLYIHDLDTNYKAVSTARNQVFSRHGLTRETGFPASTGIGGRSASHADLMMLDVLAVAGLQPGQSRAMNALTHMNATVEYGVTFERGRQLVFGDRRHLYVSGTASIDHRGKILHEFDVVRQSGRAIENIGALLAGSGAGLEDLRYVIVYLRDMADAATIEAALAAGPLAAVPRLVVHAPVCRPGWLVELEGIAITADGDSRYAPF